MSEQTHPQPIQTVSDNPSTANNPLRNGKFTSSQSVKVLGINSKSKVDVNTAMNYIEEKNMERILGRSISTESDARPLTWGKVCELYVAQLLGISYQTMNDEVFTHPKYDFWVGSPDLIKHGETKVVCEVKSPQTLKSFFSLVYGGVNGMLKGFEYNGAKFNEHKSGKFYYAQCVSNAAIMETNKAEFIVFMPKLSQLPAIRLLASELGYKWIEYATDSELPHLPDDHPKAGLNIFPFEIPKSKFDEMEDCMVEASKHLITP
jgi:hypothetical protein